MKNILFLLLLGFNSLACTQSDLKSDNLYNNYFSQPHPGDSAVIFAPGIISTAGNNEHTLSVSHNYSEIFFTRDPERRTYVTRKTGSIWSQPELASFNGREAIFSASGKELYYNDGDIWVVNYEENIEDTPGKLEGTVNTPKHEYYASSGHNKNLYFSRIDSDFAHIYLSVPVDGKYESETILPPEVNLDSCHNYHPFISPNEDFLLFNAYNYPGGIGEGDIYISFRDNKGNWTQAKNLGETVNSPLNDLCPTLSPDGQFLFFTRYNHDKREGNIYWIDFQRLLAKIGDR